MILQEGPTEPWLCRAAGESESHRMISVGRRGHCVGGDFLSRTRSKERPGNQCSKRSGRGGGGGRRKRRSLSHC